MTEKVSLDEETKKALNALSAREVSRSVSYAYEHEILWYGIEAVAHAHMLQRAKEISEGEFTREEFLSLFCLDFEEGNHHSMGDSFQFVGPLKNIESSGIFIPQHAYSTEKPRMIFYFSSDYRNRLRRTDNALYYLLDRKWQPSDLEDKQLITEGIFFARKLWNNCVEHFHEFKGGDPKHNDPPQPENVTILAERLIEYYDVIVNEE